MRFYRLLLRLYPASFRQEYGDELTEMFGRRTSGRSALVSWALALGDVAPNALSLHLEILGQDLCYTLRALRRAPGFVLTAALVVAFGVGANTAAFTMADFVLLRPLPFPKPEQLVKLWERTPGYSRMEASPANYRDWKSLTTSFSGMGAYTDYAANLVGVGTPRRLTTALVTYDLMPLLGIDARLGHVISPTDSGGNAVAVLSYGLWQTEFGGDPAVLGRQIRLSGKPYIIVGVMPEGFHFPTRETQLWTPFAFTAQSFEDRNDNWLDVIARLRPGVSVHQAAADLALANAQLVRKYPKELEKTGTNLVRMRDELSERSRALLLALCGAAACILLLACANLASLLLARAFGREREMAVRSALGAGRERLVRQLVTESVVLAALGGIAGVLVAKAALPLLARLVPDSLPIGQQPTIDGPILAFAALVVGITGLGFGLVPAIRAGGARTFDGLRAGARAGGGRRPRLRGALVAIEIAASVVLLSSSGLLVRALWRLQETDPGFRPENVLTLRTALPWPKYATTLDRAAFYDRVLAAVRALPGVQRAAYITGAPMAMGGGIWPVVITGTEVTRDDAHVASLRFVTADLFATLGIPLLRGRDVESTDDTSRTWVAVVSASFAKHFWPNDDPIGKRFNFAFHDRTIVGVVGDIRNRGLERPSEPQVYLPYKQVEDSSLIGYPPKDLLIRTNASPTAVMPAIRRIVRAIDPEQPISEVRMLDDIVSEQTAPRTAQLRVLVVLAMVALLLAGVGIHGLLSFTVSARAQEIGVRLALGARSGGIVRMILREGITLAIAGIVPGVLIAYASGRAMESLLVGVRPTDAIALGFAVILCGLATVLGCLRPALRASRVDPMAALRNE